MVKSHLAEIATYVFDRRHLRMEQARSVRAIRESSSNGIGVDDLLLRNFEGPFSDGPGGERGQVTLPLNLFIATYCIKSGAWVPFTLEEVLEHLFVSRDEFPRRDAPTFEDLSTWYDVLKTGLERIKTCLLHDTRQEVYGAVRVGWEMLEKEGYITPAPGSKHFMVDYKQRVWVVSDRYLKDMLSVFRGSSTA